MSIIVLSCAPVMKNGNPSDELMVKAAISMELDISTQDWRLIKLDQLSKNTILVVRSTWDYLDHYQEWCQFLDNVEKYKLRLFNSPLQIRTVLTKHYLLKPDFLIPPNHHIPTFLVSQGSSSQNVKDLMLQNNMTLSVLKPILSAGGKNTVLLSLQDLETPESQKLISSSLKEQDYILQPFISTIRKLGETQLIFIEGEFAHAVCRKPANQDIIIHNGTTTVVDPSNEQLLVAKEVMSRILTHTHEIPLFVRIDLLQDEKGIVRVGEVEAFEPYLLFDHVPASATLFAKALKSRLSKN